MFELKVPAVGASVGFVLSFIIGLFAGAGLGVIMVRAMGMAILFGALSLSLWYLVKRFLPELMGEPGQSVADGHGDLGGNVNITIDDAEKGDTLFSMPLSEDGKIDADLPDFMGSPSRDSGVSDLPFAESDGMVQQAAIGGGPAPAGGASFSPARQGAPFGGSTADGLDVLPDLQDFVPPETVGEDDEDAVVSDGASGRSAFAAPEVKGLSGETDTMAKAIRTILTREG